MREEKEKVTQKNDCVSGSNTKCKQFHPIFFRTHKTRHHHVAYIRIRALSKKRQPTTFRSSNDGAGIESTDIYAMRERR